MQKPVAIMMQTVVWNGIQEDIVIMDVQVEYVNLHQAIRQIRPMQHVLIIAAILGK